MVGVGGLRERVADDGVFDLDESGELHVSAPAVHALRLFLALRHLYGRVVGSRPRVSRCAVELSLQSFVLRLPESL